MSVFFTIDTERILDMTRLRCLDGLLEYLSRPPSVLWLLSTNELLTNSDKRRNSLLTFVGPSQPLQTPATTVSTTVVQIRGNFLGLVCYCKKKKCCCWNKWLNTSSEHLFSTCVFVMNVFWLTHTPLTPLINKQWYRDIFGNQLYFVFPLFLINTYYY